MERETQFLYTLKVTCFNIFNITTDDGNLFMRCFALSNYPPFAFIDDSKDDKKPIKIHTESKL